MNAERPADSAPEEMPSLFAHLVQLLAVSALQQLGKWANPITGKPEPPDLAGAQLTIDMLDMLAEKTRGRLDEQEARLLADVTASLKMAFVETAETLSSARPTPAEAAERPSEPRKPEAQAPKAEEEAPRQPRFHKKYG